MYHLGDDALTDKSKQACKSQLEGTFIDSQGGGFQAKLEMEVGDKAAAEAEIEAMVGASSSAAAVTAQWRSSDVFW